MDSNDEKDGPICPQCGTQIALDEGESAALAAAIRNGDSEDTIKCKGCGAPITLAGLDSVKCDVDKVIDDFRNSFPREFKIDFKF
ncbi:MAG: hypothetical protein WCG09_05800 [Halobacteriota archaeon]|jgi:hypothetical protein